MAKRKKIQQRKAENSRLSGICLTPKLIDEFLNALGDAGRASSTLKIYRHYLEILYEYLPEEKTIDAGVIDSWKKNLKKTGYADASAEMCGSVANSLLDWCGRGDLRGANAPVHSTAAPEITRTEYLRLLSAAKVTGHERAYLLVKAFGTLGISVNDLPLVTVEALKDGKFETSDRVVYIPKCFCDEMLIYCSNCGVQTGSVFRTASGRTMDRFNVWKQIRSLAGTALVAEEKCNPRALVKLYNHTREDIHRSVEIMENQIYERLLENEQFTYGWENEYEENFVL